MGKTWFLVNDCHFGFSPVNYPDPDVMLIFFIYICMLKGSKTCTCKDKNFQLFGKFHLFAFCNNFYENQPIYKKVI